VPLGGSGGVASPEEQRGAAGELRYVFSSGQTQQISDSAVTIDRD
jgi:hypothetical protein